MHPRTDGVVFSHSLYTCTAPVKDTLFHTISGTSCCTSTRRQISVYISYQTSPMYQPDTRSLRGSASVAHGPLEGPDDDGAQKGVFSASVTKALASYFLGCICSFGPHWLSALRLAIYKWQSVAARPTIMPTTPLQTGVRQADMRSEILSAF